MTDQDRLTVATAAGRLIPEYMKTCETRGRARIWFGYLELSRHSSNRVYAVSSRFQYEIITVSRDRALAVFNALQ